MPDSADNAATTQALLADAAVAYAEGRRDEAAALFGRVGPAASGRPDYWAMAAAVAMDRNARDEAVTAQLHARELYLGQFGRESVEQLLNLATICIAAGRADAAVDARDRAEVAIAARHEPGRDAMAAAKTQLREVDQRLAELLWQEGRQDAAISAQVRVAAALPDDLGVLRRLRTSLGMRERMLEALLVQLRIALLVPEAAGPARDAGQILRALGAASAARAWFRRALALRPDDKMALEGLEGQEAPGTAPSDPIAARLARPLEGMGGAPGDAVWPWAAARALLAARATTPAGCVAADWGVLARDAAVAALRRALALRPDHAEAAAELADLLLERQEDVAGLETLRGALKLSPGAAMLHARLGFELRRQGRPGEAQQSFSRALALNPDLPQAMVGLADSLLAAGPDPRVLALLDRARALDPGMPLKQAGTLHALALHGLRHMDEAVATFRELLESAPDDHHCHFGLGLSLLTMGRLDEGWPLYAWRWHISQSRDAWRVPAEPLRRPDPATWAGRTVLVYAEQALGDSIQFLRYVRMVAATGARVLLEVQRQIKGLAAGIPDVAGVYTREEGVPPFDVAVPLLSLPWAFGTTLDTVPATVPYLRGDLARAAQFRRRMQGLPGLKVGLVWSGDPRPNSPEQSAMDRRRSVTLAALAPLAEVPGVVFVSLQKGAPAAQAASPPPGMVLHDWTEELEDFTATASLMTALDLVISVDTAPAHLAGALGRPVWLLNRFDNDFRWLLDRDDSPWYPTMRQFRQARPGDWDGVIRRVAEALRERTGRGA